MLRTAMPAVFAAIGLSVVAGSLAAKPEKTAPLAAPVQIQVGGKPLNVHDFGNAAPFVCDFDGDGMFDLLVGVVESREHSVLRVYRNTGTNKEPAFEKFDLFQAGGEAGRVSARQTSGGFTPQVIDFDGDGIADVLSGCWSGELNFFKGQGKGKYAEGETLKDTDGGIIHLGYASSVFAVDWNGDSLLDLLVGNHVGDVHVMLNEGEAKKSAYKTATKLSAGGQPIYAGGPSHPVAADWDGDQKLDLLVGWSSGSVQFFKNEGTDKEPKLAAGEVLVPMSRANDASRNPGRGRNARICVFDWNGDGKLDLLLGDFADFAPDTEQLSKADRQALDQAKKKLAELQKEHESVSKEFREFGAPPLKKETPEEKAAREAILKKAQAKGMEMIRESDKLGTRYRELMDLERRGKLTEEQQAELPDLKSKYLEASLAHARYYLDEVQPHLQPPPDESDEARQTREAKLHEAKMKMVDVVERHREPNQLVQELAGPKPGGSVWLFPRK